MSEFSICIRSRAPSDPIELRFDLDECDSIRIYKVLKEEGVEPYEARIDECTGFLNYTPETIDEACDLYQEHQRLEDPKRWPLFLKWYQNRSIKVPKSVRNFEDTFLGLHLEPSDYLAELAIERGDIAMDFDGYDFMDWDAYAERLEDSGCLAYITDPVTKKIGVFETT